jgi:hypothetical protein
VPRLVVARVGSHTEVDAFAAALAYHFDAVVFERFNFSGCGFNRRFDNSIIQHRVIARFQKQNIIGVTIGKYQAQNNQTENFHIISPANSFTM